MPLVFWDTLHRQDLRNNPRALFVFADNEARRGKGGQAEACRGEPNAVGVATKYAPNRRDFDYWSDADYERCKQVVDADLEPVREYLRAGGWVVASRAGIGTGMSELPDRAPRLMDYIRQCFRDLLVLSRANPAVGEPPRPSQLASVVDAQRFDDPAATAASRDPQRI